MGRAISDVLVYPLRIPTLIYTLINSLIPLKKIIENIFKLETGRKIVSNT